MPCCKAKTNGQVANARSLAYRDTALLRTTPDYVLVPESEQQHARCLHICADGVQDWGTLANELQTAHRKALQHLGQWPRHAYSEPNVETERTAEDEKIGSVSRNNTISKDRNRLE